MAKKHRLVRTRGMQPPSSSVLQPCSVHQPCSAPHLAGCLWTAEGRWDPSLPAMMSWTASSFPTGRRAAKRATGGRRCGRPPAGAFGWDVLCSPSMRASGWGICCRLEDAAEQQSSACACMACECCGAARGHWRVRGLARRVAAELLLSVGWTACGAARMLAWQAVVTGLCVGSWFSRCVAAVLWHSFECVPCFSATILVPFPSPLP